MLRFGEFWGIFGGESRGSWFKVEGLGYLDPQLPSIIPQIPAIKGHKGSIKGPLGGPGRD